MKRNITNITLLGVLYVISMGLIINYSNWQTGLGVLLFGWALNIERRLNETKSR